MKLVRVNETDQVVEIFEPEDIELRFHPDFVAALREAADDVALGDVVPAP